MKLRNKKTGEIVPASNIAVGIGKDGKWYDTLAELNKDWEDYEDRPYVIDMWEDNCICDAKFGVELEGIERAKECGLYFETQEEAEKAVEKLKAWKRLKDTIIRIDRASFDYAGTATLFIRYEEEDHKKVKEDLGLLFGGGK